MPAPIATLLAGLRRLGCSPAEALALAILSLAALASVALLWVLARPSPGQVAPAMATTEMPSDAGGLALTETEVIVHVAGAVVRPGVYTLAGGSRVADAVEAAGGSLPKAVLDGLNLARPLTDGEQVLVPDRSQPAAPTAAGGGHAASGPAVSAAAAGGTSLVSLNTATVADLETLPGIGPVLAQRILDHRDSIGGFTEISELRDVSGIGEKTFQSLAPLVTP